MTREYVQQLRIKCSSPAQRAGRLSGGNQQKVVIAKWLARGAKVFLFDEPTRGIDIGAKKEVFEVMDSLARAGAAILMVSSELPELLQVADRVLVMRQGRITGELPGRTTQEEIMRLAALEETGSMIQRLLPFLTLIVLFVSLAIASPHFLTDTNLSSVVRQTAVINIMALGMTLIIVAGRHRPFGWLHSRDGGAARNDGDGGGSADSARRFHRHADRRFLGLRKRVSDHEAEHQSFHRDAGHNGHRSRPDADHFERTSGAQHPESVFRISAKAICSAFPSCSGFCWCVRC